MTVAVHFTMSTVFMITPATLGAVELNSLWDQENNHSLNWLVLILASLAQEKSEASTTTDLRDML